MAAARIFRRLAELLDVAVSSPADGEVLTYNSSTSKWGNEPSGGGSSAVLVATTHLTVPMLLDIHNTSIEVVPPPGATSVLNLLSAVAVFHFVTTPYTYLGDGLIVEARQFANFAPNLVVGTEDTYGIASAFDHIATGTELANDLDAPALIYSDTGDITGGDGTLDITVYYTIVDTA